MNRSLAKVFFACFSALLLTGMNSCVTGPDRIKVQNIRGDRDFAGIQGDQYEVWGEVTGKGEILYNTRSHEISGDTLRYGYIDRDIDAEIGALVQTGRFNGDRLIYPNTVEIARANAVAQMIDKATAMGADRIIYVVYTIDRDAAPGSKIEKITVEARGLAVKLLLNLAPPPASPAGEAFSSLPD
ncbi:hypothetical protein AGMMS50268_27380 [Spirochaetia bacterium]|nr:hypothetical protein AGMMS50268_27380 [Spirochaetia bacterium]